MTAKSMLEQDVSIIYQGASGGFMLFYYLLLTGKFTTGIKNGLDVEQLIDQQFPKHLANDRKRWKQQEFWPDNWWAHDNQIGPRLYLICNPFFDYTLANSNLQLSNHTHRILLWTDLRSQVRMAWEKRAWWFTRVSRERFQRSTETQYLRWMLSQGSKDPDVERIIKVYQPNTVIQLRDFLKNPDCLGFEPNQRQLAFLLHWISLQSQKTLRLLNLQHL